MLTTIKNYTNLVKFFHILFSLPFLFVSYFFAIKTQSEVLSVEKIAALVLCLIFARHSAMAFNRYVDRHFDKLNPRTANREIPAKKISEKHALTFAIINAVMFVITTYFINFLCFILSPVALIVIWGYSYTKRFSYLCHFILGLALMIVPVGTYIAMTNALTFSIIILGLSVLFWVAGFDIIYSIQDYEFDKQHGLHSIPVRYGINKAKVISLGCHIVSIIILFLWCLFFNDFNFFLFSGFLLFSFFVLLQHIETSINFLKKVIRSFSLTNGIASISFALFYVLGHYLN